MMPFGSHQLLQRAGFYVKVLACLPFSAVAEINITVHPGSHSTTIDAWSETQRQIATTPGNAVLVKDKAWNGQRAVNVKDITDYVPGMITQPRNGAESARLSVRGSGLANVFQGRGLLVLQDGIPINLADGGFEFPVIDPWLINHAVIFPGANALAYGASNFGGAINFITPNGATDSGYGARAEGGSFGTLHGQLAAGHAWDGGDLFAAATGFAQDGYREHNAQLTGRLNVNWGWQPNTHWANWIYFSHTASDAEIPGAISLAQISDNPQRANPNNLTGDYQRNLAITRIADKLRWADGGNSLEAALYYQYRELDNPVTTYIFQHNHDIGVRARYVQRYGASEWLVGTNHAWGVAEETRYQNNGGAAGTPILGRDLSALTSEIYGQVKQHLTAGLYGIAGAQISYASRNIRQTYPTIAEQNHDYIGFSPSAGLLYEVDAQSQIFANLSHSFEPPSWGELSGGNSPGFNQINAQSAITFEIGARGAFGALRWQAAYYHGWLRDEFVNYRFADGSTATINAPRTQRDGVEFGINGDVGQNIWTTLDALALRFAYSFNRFTLDDAPLYGNNALPGVPEHYLRAEMLYKHPAGLSFGPNLEWAPRRAPVDLTHTLYAPGYAIFGARAMWESADTAVSFYIEGRNLFDRHYVTTYNVIPDAAGQDGRHFYPGEGRAFYAGLKLKF